MFKRLCGKTYWLGVQQGSVMQTLLFLIYINDSTNRIESICKIFSMEVLFNPDLSKQAIEVCFPINVTMKIILH